MANEPTSPEPKKRLVLHIEVDDFNADDLDELAGYCSEPDPPTAEDRLYIVTEEWLRADVGLTFVTIPGEKCGNDDFEVFARTGRIVGAETRDVS
jgi:hypothetical protein